MAAAGHCSAAPNPGTGGPGWMKLGKLGGGFLPALPVADLGEGSVLE